MLSRRGLHGDISNICKACSEQIDPEGLCECDSPTLQYEDGDRVLEADIPRDWLKQIHPDCLRVVETGTFQEDFGLNRRRDAIFRVDK